MNDNYRMNVSGLFELIKKDLFQAIDNADCMNPYVKIETERRNTKRDFENYLKELRELVVKECVKLTNIPIAHADLFKKVFINTVIKYRGINLATKLSFGDGGPIKIIFSSMLNHLIVDLIDLSTTTLKLTDASDTFYLEIDIAYTYGCGFKRLINKPLSSVDASESVILENDKIIDLIFNSNSIIVYYGADIEDDATYLCDLFRDRICEFLEQMVMKNDTNVNSIDGITGTISRFGPVLD